MRTISIRTSLLRSIVALVLFMSVTLLVVTVLGARRAVQDLTERLIEQSAGQAEEQLDSFFGSIEGILASSRAWWESGLVEYSEPEDVASLNNLFIPVLDAYPQVTSMMLADDTGFEYLLFRDLRGGDDYEWYNRIVLADEGPDAGFETRWTEERELHSQGPLPEESLDYDPRQRPFYTAPPSTKCTGRIPTTFSLRKTRG